MKWEDIGSIVADAAPIIGGLVGGPAGAGVGSLIANALGVKPDPVSVKQALTNDPDAMAKIAEAEMKHKEELQQIALEESKAILIDKQQAREVHKNSIMPNLVTIVLLLLLTLAMGGLAYVAIPQGNKDVVNMLIGNLIGFVSSAVAFWLGAPREKLRK